MKTALFLSLCLSVSGYAQIRDSVYTEMVEKQAPLPADTSERAATQKSRLSEFFRKNRRETTMFQVGIVEPIAFTRSKNDHSLVGLWVGINQKLRPALGIRVGVNWRPAWLSNTNAYNANNAGVLSQVAIDYYPFITRDIREGKAANNFYHQPFLTLESNLALAKQMITETATGSISVSEPFQQSLGVGIGTCSSRTRWYFYSVSAKIAYWFNRNGSTHHPVQPMIGWTLGIAL